MYGYHLYKLNGGGGSVLNDKWVPGKIENDVLGKCANFNPSF